MRYYFIIGVLASIAVNVYSSVKDTVRTKECHWILEYSGHPGKQIKTYTQLPENDITLMNELRFAIQTDGREQWHQYYGYPQAGVSLFIGFLGNPDVLGHCIAVAPNITLRTRKDKKFCFQPTLGLGLSWFTKPNDPANNPENLMVGSEITNITYTTLYFRYKINKHIYLKTGISYFHFSNGHYQLPNVGMNMPSATMGIVYHSFSALPKLFINTSGSIDKKLKLTIRFGMGIQEFGTATGPIGDEKYPVYVTSIYFSKRFGTISNIHMGINATYYQRFYDYYKSHNTFEDEEFKKSSVLTIFLAHEFLAGHFGCIGQGGINIYAPQHNMSFKLSDRWISLDSPLESFVSTKLGVQYYIFSTDVRMSKNLSIGVFLKANFGQADFVEISIGYTF